MLAPATAKTSRKTCAARRRRLSGAGRASAAVGRRRAAAPEHAKRQGGRRFAAPRNLATAAPAGISPQLSSASAALASGAFEKHWTIIVGPRAARRSTSRRVLQERQGPHGPAHKLNSRCFHSCAVSAPDSLVDLRTGTGMAATPPRQHSVVSLDVTTNRKFSRRRISCAPTAHAFEYARRILVGGATRSTRSSASSCRPRSDLRRPPSRTWRRL